ncbi:MAG: pyruvate kinase [Candidatus Dojkabacteria bacterium]|jgi:pyruvate kinase|nr:pyruvate kinase [Candidatus Dojkabacteria bacterium]MDD2270030.1 pyruvate kinase [Candidatus Dojkabacteria bacterium]
MTAPKFCKSKIVATIGPASWEKEVIKGMVVAGMDLARVNASFADFDELKRVKDLVRSISPRVSLILDTMGNKIRVVGFTEPISVRKNESLVLIPESQQSSQNSQIQITYESLHDDLSRGAKILIDDGNLELTVTDIIDKSIICNVENNYIIKPNKTVNIPNQQLHFPILTEKDIQDIKNAVELKYDFIALSFVENTQVILDAREIIGESGINIISKIENQAGVDNFEEILEASDAIMIARGDLGVEIPYEHIPIIQKQLIYRCRAAGKPVIVATQMLESMRENPRPTRAEINDVANSIIDGADALMLSAETSTGLYPVESVNMINRTALATEDVLTPQMLYGNTQANRDTDEICRTVFNLTNSIDLKAVIILSQSGRTVSSLSRHRPTVPIFEISNDIQRIRIDNLLRGVKCYYSKKNSGDRDESIQNAVEIVFSYGELDFTDKIAIISGSSIKNKCNNTILEIATVKDLI